VIAAAGVHAAAVPQRHTLVVAEDEARLALAALHAHALAAGRPDGAQTRLGTGAGTQGVGAVGGAARGCVEMEGEDERMAISSVLVVHCVIA